MVGRNLLKLKQGNYLVTDNCCNNTYVLKRHDGDYFIATIYEEGCIYRSTLSIFKDEETNRIKTMMSMAGISMHDKDDYILKDLHVVCKYNAETNKKTLDSFRMNMLINTHKTRKYLVVRKYKK